MSKAWELPKLSKKFSLTGSGASWNQKKVSRDNHSQKNYGKLWFSCKIAHYGKGLNSFFQEFFASVNKMFILAGRLGNRVSFYGV